MIALLSAAWASPAHTTVSLGVEHVVNDPYLLTTGPRASVAVRVYDQLEIHGFGAWYPLDSSEECENPRWTAAACALATDLYVSPDITYPVARGGVGLGWIPLRGAGPVKTAAGVYAGFGMVYTEDDLRALQSVGDPAAESTAHQLHLGPYGGVMGEVEGARFGGRLRLEGFAYEEVVSGDVAEQKRPLFVGVEAYLRL